MNIPVFVLYWSTIVVDWNCLNWQGGQLTMVLLYIFFQKQFFVKILSVFFFFESNLSASFSGDWWVGPRTCFELCWWRNPLRRKFLWLSENALRCKRAWRAAAELERARPPIPSADTDAAPRRCRSKNGQSLLLGKCKILFFQVEMLPLRFIFNYTVEKFLICLVIANFLCKEWGYLFILSASSLC